MQFTAKKYKMEGYKQPTNEGSCDSLCLSHTGVPTGNFTEHCQIHLSTTADHQAYLSWLLVMVLGDTFIQLMFFVIINKLLFKKYAAMYCVVDTNLSTMSTIKIKPNVLYQALKLS